MNAEPPNRLAIWLQAVRPKTLGACIAPVLMGTAMAYEAGGGHALAAMTAFVAALLIQVGTNFANDYYDFVKGTDSFRVSGPKRMTQAGLVAPGTMKRAFIVVFTLAFAAGALLYMRAGWPILAIGIVSIAAGILYTGGPMPLGYVGLGDIFVLVFFGPVALGGAYYVQTLEINSTVLFIGLCPGLISMALLTVNNLRDIDEDRQAGKRTLAVRFGRGFAKVEFLGSLLAAALVPVALFVYTGEHAFSLLTLLYLALAVPTVRLVLTVAQGPELNRALAGTGKLLLVFATLFAIGWML